MSSVDCLPYWSILHHWEGWVCLWSLPGGTGLFVNGQDNFKEKAWVLSCLPTAIEGVHFPFPASVSPSIEWSRQMCSMKWSHLCSQKSNRRVLGRKDFLSRGAERCRLELTLSRLWSGPDGRVFPLAAGVASVTLFSTPVLHGDLQLSRMGSDLLKQLKYLTVASCLLSQSCALRQRFLPLLFKTILREKWSVCDSDSL